jgi:hypothetical protein
VSFGGQAPVLTLSSEASTATTIEAEFTTKWTSTPTMVCGTSPGVYTFTSKDTGISGMLQQIISGLTPSTTYYCQVTATNATGSSSAAFTKATIAAAPSTPATSMSLGTISTYNSINASNQGSADTFFNAVAANGTTYLTNDDTNGFSVSGVPPVTASSLSVLKQLSTSPLVFQTSNPLYAYPPNTSPGTDGNDQKDNGLFTVGGKMFMLIGRQTPSITHPYIPQYDGQMIESPDNGQTWNNFQNPTVYNYPGSPTTPINTAMWGTSPTSYADATFVMGCADDGTLGYTTACNQTDNRNVFAYIIGNDTNFAGGSGCGLSAQQNDYWLMRVPLAKIANLNPSDYQAFTGGDGNLDANWSSTLTNAVSILHACAELGLVNVQYVPAKNSYVMLNYYAPNGLNTDPNTTTWHGWTAPHLWGPWTVVYTQNWTSGTAPPGSYNPIILNSTIWSGLTPTIMFTGAFTDGTYQMYLATLTIN